MIPQAGKHVRTCELVCESCTTGQTCHEDAMGEALGFELVLGADEQGGSFGQLRRGPTARHVAKGTEIAGRGRLALAPLI